MKNNTMYTRKNVAYATKFLVGKSYTEALSQANTLKGEIGETAQGLFKATFKTPKLATEFASKFNKAYDKATQPSRTQAPTQAKGKNNATEEMTTILNGVKYKLVPMTEDKPSSTKKSTPKATAKKSTTSTKKAPTKSKGKTFDYSVIKGKDNQAKNKALHKELVKMGHKDSRTPEYMSIWNARPWAK